VVAVAVQGVTADTIPLTPSQSPTCLTDVECLKQLAAVPTTPRIHFKARSTEEVAVGTRVDTTLAEEVTKDRASISNETVRQTWVLLPRSLLPRSRNSSFPILPAESREVRRCRT